MVKKLMAHKYSKSQLDAFVQEFKRDGFCLLPNFIDRAKIQKWSDQFAPLLDAHLKTQADPSFRGAQRFYVTLPFAQPFADPDIFDNDDIIAIMEQIAGKDFVMCQLATDTPLLGSEYQPIHSDAPPLFDDSVTTPSFQLAFNFPLVDVTDENGPLEITRGTHMIKRDEGLKKIESGEIKIESIKMKMGDAIIRDVRCLHRGTPNKTSVPRPMVVLGYSRRWFFRPEVNIQIPKDTLAQLSPRAQHMLRFNPVVDELPKEHRETYKTFAY